MSGGAADQSETGGTHRPRGRFFVRIWLPAYVALQLGGSIAISQMMPDGFNRCTAPRSPAEQQVQVVIAVISLVLLLVAAVIWLRGWYLVVCAWLVVFAALWWWVLLFTPSNC